MQSAHTISVAEPEPAGAGRSRSELVGAGRSWSELVGAGLFGWRREPEPELEDESSFTHTMFKKLKNTLNLGHLTQTNVFTLFIFLCII